MKAHRFDAAGVFAVVVSMVMADSNVKERNSSFSCCENPAISFNQQCENTWNTNHTTIAYYKGADKPECIHPCKKLEAGHMLLDECANVTATVVCANEKNVAEERIRYYSLPCSGSRLAAENQGSIVLVLLPAVIGGLFVGMIG